MAGLRVSGMIYRGKLRGQHERQSTGVWGLGLIADDVLPRSTPAGCSDLASPALSCSMLGPDAHAERFVSLSKGIAEAVSRPGRQRFPGPPVGTVVLQY